MRRREPEVWEAAGLRRERVSKDVAPGHDRAAEAVCQRGVSRAPDAAQDRRECEVAPEVVEDRRRQHEAAGTIPCASGEDNLRGSRTTRRLGAASRAMRTRTAG